jgi:hypothetical protein
MRRERLVTTLGIVICSAAVGAAWWHVYRPSALSAVLGIENVVPTQGSTCEPMMSWTHHRPIPTGREWCVRFLSGTESRLPEQRQLEFGVSRRVTYAKRTWQPDSEEAWQYVVDSIRGALRERGGTRAECHVALLNQLIEGWLEQWHFPGYSVNIFTAHERHVLAATNETWFIDITSGTDFPYRCREDRETPV